MGNPFWRNHFNCLPSVVQGAVTESKKKMYAMSLEKLSENLSALSLCQ